MNLMPYLREKRSVRWIVGVWLLFHAFFLGVGYWGGSLSYFYSPLFSLFNGGFIKHLDYITSHPFPSMCVGSALDQPSIGKFFLFYTFLSGVAFLTAIIMRVRTDMQKDLNRRVFLICYVLAFLFVMSFMLLPATQLAHYIIDMGMTPKRQNGVICLVVSVLVWPILGILLMFRRKAK